MRKVFVDTNILVDLLANRKPYSKYAIALFRMAEAKKIKLYTSSHTIATSHYLLMKFGDEKKLRKTMIALFNYLHVVPLNADILLKGFRSNHRDVEDAFQLFCAYSIPGMDCIVTRNVSDFKGSSLPVFAPHELTWLEPL